MRDGENEHRNLGINKEKVKCTFDKRYNCRGFKSCGDCPVGQKLGVEPVTVSFKME